MDKRKGIGYSIEIDPQIPSNERNSKCDEIEDALKRIPHLSSNVIYITENINLKPVEDENNQPKMSF
ncbi:MAG: hypothetical protein H0U71_02925 [Gammaproteobacteria bacterium]|nr:hypothetical protein [Gammaproteobacteria bacterium]